MNFKSDIRELNDLKQKMALISQESSTYEKLAYYIVENYKHIIFMTAAEVAAEVNISQGSVSRFCSSLGYHGYNDFQHNLQQFVREEITAPQRLQYTSHDNNSITNILNMEHKNIDELNFILNQPSYEKLIEKIVSARHLVITSSRMSATLLPYTNYILNKIRNDVIQVTPESPLWDTLEFRDVTATLIFTIMFPRYPNNLIQKLKELKKKGFTIAAVTDSIMSPVTNLADPVISVPITTSSIFDIYSTPILFLNLLLRDIARETEGLDKRLESIEKSDECNNFYYKM
ncbi:MAG: MurR/RpiR family transcriptional regulator [Clostridium sp.]|jgi:DNA-binding MurR/RpiR family transcriptional regulator|uniref:MurR/RpiR family transcriptional regulator n=1 Tax=Clostridium sp. TaxID=1506 RepID=UPI0025BED02A|nr:MurR/RpiR family transcriptional regulator [Clostridium sp.]MCH3963455.1 MurR/RpiR family transcriptional regulator [Clostridium sp.]MCI1716677.1 MurR/RpiR family transcriptional regulator [Clostridium sp.]MCI1801139.1 MurR/RpiR family transcriptional regulator [Clostridium sp.]MCI1814863.1 MurR/RpiR family transcriptional regulator [Clostridium sp.]MCI1871764.1 MurR/RpiR family transcriptional regulator [Clostridium sp.]